MNFATAPEDPTRFVPLMVVLSLAFLVPVILARLRRVPVVVGEILAGLIVGPSVLGIVGDGPILTFMADIGLAFLMFLAGLEIDFDALFPDRDQPKAETSPNLAQQSLWIYLATLALAIPGGFVLNRLGLEGDPWLLAFVLSATSLGVLLPVLKERDMTESRFGKVVFFSATLADFMTVILLTIYIITLDKGFDFEIFSIGLLFIAFLVLSRIGPRFIRVPRVRQFFEDLSRATVQIKVRGAIAIFMAFVVLAEYVDAELILGAFLAGMIISLIKDPQDVDMVHKLEAFGFGFFIPVFFIMVGVDLDLNALFGSPSRLLLVPVLFLLSLLVKIPPMFLLRRQFPARDLIGGGLLLNTHLSLEIAVAVIGLRVGLFDAASNAAVILFAVVTVVFMPLLFGALVPFTAPKRQHVMLVIGVRELALKVAQELRLHGEEVQFLEDDPELVALVKEAGFEVREFPTEPAGLREVDFAEVLTILVLGRDDEQNLALCREARSQGAENVVAYVNDPAALPQYERLGTKPFIPATQRVTMITMMARNPDALALLTSSNDGRDIVEVYLGNSHLKGELVRNLQLPGGFLVLAIRRDGQLLVPRGNTVLEYGDRLSVLGEGEELQAVKGWLEGRSGRPLSQMISQEVARRV